MTSLGLQAYIHLSELSSCNRARAYSMGVLRVRFHELKDWKTSKDKTRTRRNSIKSSFIKERLQAGSRICRVKWEREGERGKETERLNREIMHTLRIKEDVDIYKGTENIK